MAPSGCQGATPAGISQQECWREVGSHGAAPSQLEANPADNPNPPPHRPNDFHIKLPDVLPGCLPIPFPYRSAPK